MAHRSTRIQRVLESDDAVVIDSNPVEGDAFALVIGVSPCDGSIGLNDVANVDGVLS